ncbi:MAG: hypothetical protein JXB46_07100 [Candidatus Eisenbacteria bacterium]|nr:hypothetical protein [Candidatus Eisenbacteria bacterium]
MTFALGSTGAVTLVVQVLLLRELLTSWHGNEMSFGVVLSLWLITGGLGAAAFGVVFRKYRAAQDASRPGLQPHPALIATLLLVLGALSPVTLFVARFARVAMGLQATELVGFTPLVVASLISVLPFTAPAGFLFALATSVLSDLTRRSREAGGRVYVAEAAGAAVSGLLVSLVLLPRSNPIAISLLATVLCCVSGAVLLVASSRRQGRPPFVTLSVAAALGAAAVIVAIGLSGRLDDLSVAVRWRELGFQSQTNSKYGRIVATSMGSQDTVYENGVLAASSPDRLRAEEIVHLPMLEHADPGAVLLLGGGLGGAVGEILKHPGVRSVDYVELDPEIIRVARRSFGEAMLEGLDDPRVRVHFGDARFFVKRTSSRYDVVIVGVPDPETAQLNRFYTLEAMEELRRILTDRGVVGLSISSTENYVSDEQARLLACLSATVKRALPHLVMLPGDPCHIIASRSPDYLTRDADVLIDRVRRRDLDVVYIRDYYLSDRLNQERTEELDRAVAGVPATINSDLTPIGYYLDLVVWQKQFAGGSSLLARAPRFINGTTVAAAAVLVLLALGLPALSTHRPRRSLARGVFAAVLVVGATEISLELAALLAFQSIYGYVYHQLAIIVAGFMAGLAAGGWLGVALVRRGAGLVLFAALQACVALVPLTLGWALREVAGLPPSSLASWAYYFPALVVGSALLAGVQFPLAVRLLAASPEETGRTAGRLYAADLAGAALGAPLSAVFLLPLLGVWGTMLALFGVNIALVPCLLLPAIRSRRGL